MKKVTYMDEKKLIKKCKKNEYNFIWNNNKIGRLMTVIFASTPFYSLSLEFLPSKYEILFYIFCLLICIFLFWVYDEIRKYPVIESYSKSSNFVGIYNVDDLYGKDKEYYKNTLIKRIKEVEYLEDILSKIYAHKSSKQSICIIGESGSGKSTIISKLQNKLEKDINIINCSNRYRDLEQFLTKNFDVEKLDDMFEKLIRSNKKNLFIFDQFERFFLLDEPIQIELKRKIFDKLNIDNTTSIFVLREDKFPDFIYSTQKEKLTSSGILVETFCNVWYLNNHMLFCKNDVDLNFSINRNNEKSDILKNRNNDLFLTCQNVFQTDKVYQRFKSRKLIEKQIYFNLLENEYKNHAFNFVHFLNENSDRDLLVRYYDKQLCSTGNYYDAARIMYLLSLGRIYNQLYSLAEIQLALLIKEKSINKFNKCLEDLTKLKLIRKIQENSINYYEIVHDYIAESYIEYAETDMHLYIKNTIHDFRVNYKNKKYKKGLTDCIEQINKPLIYENILLAFVLLSITITSIYYIFILKNDYNPVINILLYMASYYGYKLYCNIFKLYSGSRKWILNVLFIAMAFWAILASVFYKFWLLFSGLGTITIGLSFLVIQFCKDFSRVSKEFYFDFSKKVIGTGLAIFVSSFFFVKFNISIYLAAFLVLCELIYAYGAQLSEQYFYYCIGLLHSKK